MFVSLVQQLLLNVVHSLGWCVCVSATGLLRVAATVCLMCVVGASESFFCLFCGKPEATDRTRNNRSKQCGNVRCFVCLREQCELTRSLLETWDANWYVCVYVRL